MNAATTNAVKVERLERETCSRCGGSGRYSYCQMYGDTCFRCAGAGVTLTTRGAAAMAFLKDIRKVRATAVQVGDTLKFGGCTMGGTPYTKALRVGKIEIVERKGASLKDGVMVDYCHTCFQITDVKESHSMIVGLDSMVDRVGTREEQLETLKAAVAYQATLGKNGKPKNAVRTK